jgi:hypothetical protein
LQYIPDYELASAIETDQLTVTLEEKLSSAGEQLGVG